MSRVVAAQPGMLYLGHLHCASLCNASSYAQQHVWTDKLQQLACLFFDALEQTCTLANPCSAMFPDEEVTAVYLESSSTHGTLNM